MVADAEAVAGPVVSRERIAAIDTLRGVALLGILVINIPFFAMSIVGLEDPRLAGEFSGANRWTWILCFLFFDQKMMTLFSALFGAGIALQAARADAGGTPLTGRFLRRTGWLLALGLIHAYLIWFGDILTSYALCAVGVYWFRRCSPRTLIALGLLVLSISVLLSSLFGWYLEGLAQADPAAYRAELENLSMKPEVVAEERRAFGHGSYLDQLRVRAGFAFVFQTFVFIYYDGSRVGGLMLIGMALLKLGWLSGQRSRRSYCWLMLIGLGLGLPLDGYGIHRQLATGFDTLVWINEGYIHYLASLLVSLGYLGLVMLAVRSDRFSWVAARLAAVGRMALTHYLLQSLICTTLIYSWGFALYDRVDRVGLVGLVLGIWAFQLWVSPIWLARYRFGPLEWAWRSLTYWRRQPFRNS